MVQRVVGKGRVETPLSLQLLEHLECRFLGCDEHVVAARKPSSEGSKHVNTHVTLKSLQITSLRRISRLCHRRSQ